MRILLAVLPSMLFAGTAQAEPLAFRIDAAGSIDAFYQDGPVAAHVVLTAAPSPRLVVAFPAGNSGVALWLAGAAAQWRLTSDPRPVSEGEAVVLDCRVACGSSQGRVAAYPLLRRPAAMPLIERWMPPRTRSRSSPAR